MVKGHVARGDALSFLATLDAGSADILFLDPPFNLNKRYSDIRPGLDRRDEDDYALWLQTILLASVRVLAPGGALYLYHLPKWAMRVGPCIEQWLEFRHWVAVSMKNGFVRGAQRLYPAHYALLMFTKGPPTYFVRPKLAPKACRHCGELVKDYGGYRHIIEAKGLNLSDVWDDLSPVRHANRKHRKANELPPELFRRIFEMSGRPGGLYVDPFSGSGAGALFATRAKMRFAVCDLLNENSALACDRIASSIRRKGN